jgi:hypothetical protein
MNHSSDIEIFKDAVEDVTIVKNKTTGEEVRIPNSLGEDIQKQREQTKAQAVTSSTIAPLKNTWIQTAKGSDVYTYDYATLSATGKNPLQERVEELERQLVLEREERIKDRREMEDLLDNLINTIKEMK